MQYMGELGVEELMARIARPEQQPKLVRLNATLIARHTVVHPYCWE